VVRNTLPRIGVCRFCGSVDLVQAMQDRADPAAAGVALDAGRRGVDGGCPRFRSTGCPWRRQQRPPPMQEDGIAMAAAVSVDGGDDRARHTRKGFFAARSRSRMTGWCWRRLLGRLLGRFQYC
jgi:hypothetical protein